MLKSKVMFGVIALAMVLTLAQSGYAQLTISAIGNPSPHETATSRTAETNDPTTDNGLIITGTILSDAPITGGRLRIQYPVIVSNDATFPGSDPVSITRVSNPTGIFAGATVVVTPVVSSSNRTGRVEINLPCGSFVTGSTGTIILTGVRIDASAGTAPVSATLSNVAISSSGSRHPSCVSASVPANAPINPVNVIVNTGSVEVITALSPGIDSVASGGLPSSVTSGSAVLGTTPECPGSDALHANCGVATINTNRNVPKGVASFTVTEGQTWGWFNCCDTTQFAGASGFTKDAAFRLTFNGIPSGVTLTLAVAAFNTSSGYTSNPALSRTSITTGNNTTDVSWGNDVSPSATDRVAFRITNITTPSSGSLATGSITVSATMIPIGLVLDDQDNVITTDFPRYSELQVGNATIANIIPANTTLLIPFATCCAYDTGIAVANTTKDPFGGTAGGGAIEQAGTVQVFLFPTTATGAGTAINFITSATKRAGLGIAADGTIPAGATWAVNLSELLPLAGGSVTTGFTGYIFIQTNFLNAHGTGYIYDGKGFTANTPMLVLPPPSIVPRTSGVVEALDF